ncbi:MAG: transporter substrate-binding domain-containing protein [Desulfobacterales bacterium]|nr:transporter substrate-binding domain-containing protein [Desulfobacterales bacterium]
MISIQKILIATMIALMFSSTAFAEKLVIGMATAFKPYNYSQEKQWTGIDVEIIEEVFRRLGINVEFREYPWARVLLMAEVGKIDGILSVYCNDRHSFLENTNEPSYSVKISFFSLKTDNPKITELDDFNGKSVGVNRGNYYAKYIENYEKIKIFKSVDVKMLVRQLYKKRIDFALHEVGPFLYYSKEIGFKECFDEVYELKSDSVCMAFSKKALGSRSKELADKVSMIIHQLKSEGYIQKVTEKYLGK